MTRENRKYRDCDPCVNNGGSFSELSPYLSRLVNNITVEGAAVDNIAPDYIVYTLATAGGIAYIKSTNDWVEFMPDGPRRVFGTIPARVRLWSEEGQAWSQPISITREEDICIFPANAEFYPLANKIRELVQSLNTVEDSISQNLDNLRQLTVIVTRDKKLKNQLTALNKLRQSGTCAYGVIDIPQNKDSLSELLTQEEAKDALTMLSLSPNSENYLSTYLELKKDYREELNNVIGVTEIAEKQERRINSEMELIENSTYAMIDLLIDSINKYAKFYNVDILAHRAHGGCAKHSDEAVAGNDTESKISLSEEGINNESDNQQ